MKGKIFYATKQEDREGVLRYEYIMSQSSRIKDFSFEESSIDMALSCEPRFVDTEGNVYEPFRQYFIQEGPSTTSRLLVCVPTRKG